MFPTKKRANYFLLIFLLLVITGVLKPVRRFAGQKIYEWQRSLKKDLNGCELKNEKEIAEMKIKIASLEEENKQQKRLLSAPLPKNWQFLTTKVISLAGEVLIINLGSDDGVKEGMVVILENTYLGKVKKTGRKSAEVRLPTFFEEKTVVNIFSEKDKTVIAKGLLVGKGEGRMKAEQIYLSENIQKGDLVAIHVGAADLLVGVVEETGEKKGEMFKFATIKRLYNPEQLQTVFVVK